MYPKGALRLFQHEGKGWSVSNAWFYLDFLYVNHKKKCSLREYSYYTSRQVTTKIFIDSYDKSRKWGNVGFSKWGIWVLRNDEWSICCKYAKQSLFQVQNICDGLPYQVEVRNITQRITCLGEKLDAASSLSEPRENSFLTCDFTHNDALMNLAENLKM